MLHDIFRGATQVQGLERAATLLTDHDETDVLSVRQCNAGVLLHQ